MTIATGDLPSPLFKLLHSHPEALVLQLLEDTAAESTDVFAIAGRFDEPGDDPFTKSRVAELSPGCIAQMSSGEMAQAIRDVSVLRFCDTNRLEYLDRPTLERLVYLARRCCRNQGY